VTLEEYADIVQAWRDVLRKAKIHLELNLVREMKDNKAALSTSPAKGRLGKHGPATECVGESA